MKKIIAGIMSVAIAISCAVTPITAYGFQSAEAYGINYDESTEYKVKVNSDLYYGYAFNVLDIVNSERKANGLAPLEMDKELLDVAMYRAVETSIYWDHTRPDGTLAYSASSKLFGENIACGQFSASEVMNDWMNSEGHRENILSPSYKSIGIGCIYANGGIYWVQCFNVRAATEEALASSYDYVLNDTAEIVGLSSNISPAISGSKSLTVGDTTSYKVYQDGGFGSSGTYFDQSCVSYTSSDPSVLYVSSDGSATAISDGTVTVTAYISGNTKLPVTAKVTVKPSQTGNTVSSKKSISGGKITCGSSYAFTGKNIKPSVTVKVGSTKLTKNKDYTVKYSNNKKVGTATITVTGKGKYTGKLTKTFKINPAKQKIQKLTAKKKAFYIDYVQKDSATGYEIQYATNSKFSKAKTVKVTKKKTDKKTISKLSGKKKYWVRVRSYTIVKGKKYTGAWSPVKTVTTKK